MGTRRRLSLALLSILAGGCGGSAPTPAAAPAPASHRTSADSEIPARWLSTDGATLVGPEVAGGTLVLVGGRRALVAPSGIVTPERAPSPEPLLEVFLVPTSDGMRLVGLSRRALVTFDDPLGAPRVLAAFR